MQILCAMQRTDHKEPINSVLFTCARNYVANVICEYATLFLIPVCLQNFVLHIIRNVLSLTCVAHILLHIYVFSSEYVESAK